MERSQTTGAILMAVPSILMLIFTLGVLRKSYLAVALPVLGAVGAVSGVLFWIGYTMLSMEPDMAELDGDEPEPAEAPS